MALPLCCPDYSQVSKWAKRVSISIKTSTRGEIPHLVIDSTGLKVFSEGEWKVRQHSSDRHSVWRTSFIFRQTERRMRLSVPIYRSVALTDAQALPGLINQIYRKLSENQGSVG